MLADSGFASTDTEHNLIAMDSEHRTNFARLNDVRATDCSVFCFLYKLANSARVDQCAQTSDVVV